MNTSPATRLSPSPSRRHGNIHSCLDIKQNELYVQYTIFKTTTSRGTSFLFLKKYNFFAHSRTKERRKKGGILHVDKTQPLQNCCYRNVFISSMSLMGRLGRIIVENSAWEKEICRGQNTLLEPPTTTKKKSKTIKHNKKQQKSTN